MRRPFVLIALLFGAGTVVGLWGIADPVSPRFLLGVAMALWFMASGLALRGSPVAAQVLVLWLVLVLGVLSARLPREEASLHSVLPLEASMRVGCIVSGVVVAEPDVMAKSPLRFLVQVHAVEIDDRVLRVHETVPVLVYGSYGQTVPRRWQHWSFAGTLRYHPEDFRGYWFFVSNARQSSRIRPPSGLWMVWSDQLRRRAAETLRIGLADRPDRYGVVQALLLGYRMHVPADVQTTFRRTGTMHIFAISGLHVGILCAVLVFVINLLRVPRTCRVLVLAPVILLYAFMTGARASAIRAGVMAVTYLAAPFFGRRSDSWSALALAFVLILAWRPDQLQDPGFVFSFAAVAGILGMVPLFEIWLQRFLPRDPFRERAQGEGARETVLLWSGRLVSVSLAAWLSTTPLSLYYFGRLAPIALLANLVVVPLAFLIVVTGCLSLVGAAIGGDVLAEIPNQANFAYVGLLTRCMQWFERVPWGFRENLWLSVSGVILWYLFLGAIVIFLYKRLAVYPIDRQLVMDI
jgi:ComEC/Rec2-related protein